MRTIYTMHNSSARDIKWAESSSPFSERGKQFTYLVSAFDFLSRPERGKCLLTEAFVLFKNVAHERTFLQEMKCIKIK